MPAPVILWFRRDLRLSDNPALDAAIGTGRPIIPLFVLDETEGVRAPGAAALWWLDKSLAALAEGLEGLGARLVLRRGPAGRIIEDLAKEAGAAGVYWSRLYDPGVVDRDTALKASLKAGGIDAVSCNASLLAEPWEVATKGGQPFKVFTPFWRAARPGISPGPARPAPAKLPAPDTWPRSDRLESWRLHPTAPDWSTGFGWTPGEAGAQARLDDFVKDGLADYPLGRDRPDRDGSSRLSPHLHWGEVGPRQVWRRVEAAVARGAATEKAAETFLAELGWREFNHQLLFHRPDMAMANMKPAFDSLSWRVAPEELEAWKRGRTGYPIVDAGMRQLWATGWMHNRVRMIVGSFLVKDLLIDWREGERWFWDTLVDADAANNAGNWQWVAGSGADASPFFRIFNPTSQGERFDPHGHYVRRWVPELAGLPDAHIHSPWTAPAGLAHDDYPNRIVDHGRARERALAALKATHGVALNDPAS
jgi:deoxyribodipyrimidine photo-lyase